MKLVCLASGGLPELPAAVTAQLLDPSAPELLRRITDHCAEGILCAGQAGIQAGLFLLRKKRLRPRIPVICLWEKGAKTGRFDGVVCRTDADRRAALDAGTDLYQLFDSVEAAVSACSRRLSAGKKPGGVVISGSYGLGNLGDEAMLTAILAQLREAAPDRPVTVITRTPRQTRRDHAVSTVGTFRFVSIFRALRRAAFLISGGGTLLTDLTSTRSLRYYLFVIRLAKRVGARVLLYSCGIGPIASPSNRRAVAKTLDHCAEVISARDDASFMLLDELGVTSPKRLRMWDATFALTGASDGPKTGGQLCAVYALRHWDRDEAFIPAAAEAIETIRSALGLYPVLLAMEPAQDLPFAECIADRLNGPFRIVADAETFDDVVALVRGASVVVGMRLHALIAACGAGVPCAGVDYDVKIGGFLSDTGNPARIDYATAEADDIVAAAALAIKNGAQPFEATDENLLKTLMK